MAARNVNLAIKKFRSARPLESSARAPAEFEKFVVDETEKWGRVVQFAGIKAE